MDDDRAETDPFVAAKTAAEALAAATGASSHDVAIVLGTGLDGAHQALGAPEVDLPVTVLPGFVPPTAPGHAGRVASTMSGGARVLVWRGRVHLYEGRSADQVAHAVRTSVTAGCQVVIITSVSGGIDPSLRPGEVVMINDHLNMTGRSPLTGRWATSRFVDLTDAWSPRLRALTAQVAPGLRESVYAQMPGPQFETPAEVRMLQAMGAGLVGMSTVIEAIAARHAGAEVLGLSVVVNHAAGMAPGPVVIDQTAMVDGVERLGRIVLVGVVAVLA